MNGKRLRIIHGCNAEFAVRVSPFPRKVPARRRGVHSSGKLVELGPMQVARRLSAWSSGSVMSAAQQPQQPRVLNLAPGWEQGSKSAIDPWLLTRISRGSQFLTC